VSLILSLLACQSAPTRVPGELYDQGQRIQAAEVTFNLWTDYVPLLGALDAECRWIPPALSDDTTPWPPFQAFWLIHDNPSDVTQETIPDTFFVGDGLLPDDFPSRADLPVLGFKAFTGFQQSLLDVQEVRESDDGRTLEADFGAPIDATVRVTAAEDCTVTTEVCPAGCDAYTPLERIHLDLGALFTVQDVRFE
jgi:hypothetical protein